MPNKQTYSIPAVEVFSAGVWNGDEYTMDDLQSMVEAFNETHQGVRPYIKLGHDESQTLLQEDGLPAAGWIERLYIKGDKLVADIADIPKKIYDLIQSKAYRKVSSEIYWNLKVGEKLYKRFLGAVALLGSDMPGCMNLSDILGRYRSMTSEPVKIYSQNMFEIKQNSITIEEEGDLMPQKLEELEAEVKTFKAESEAKAAELEKAKAENDELKKYKAQIEVEKAEALAKVKVAEDEAFVAQLASENLCTPAMKPFVLAILGEEKKEYSVKTEKEEVKISKKDLLKETLKLFKVIDQVNLDESSRSGAVDKMNGTDEAFNQKVAKYASDNKCSYGQAVKAVMAEQRQTK